MWPCGIVTLLCELFISESKAQVYGHLHYWIDTTEGAKYLSEFKVLDMIVL